jgi:hypothetical protein
MPDDPAKDFKKPRSAGIEATRGTFKRAHFIEPGVPGVKVHRNKPSSREKKIWPHLKTEGNFGTGCFISQNRGS